MTNVDKTTATYKNLDNEAMLAVRSTSPVPSANMVYNDPDIEAWSPEAIEDFSDYEEKLWLEKANHSKNS